jgi:hypothetical protein
MPQLTGSAWKTPLNPGIRGETERQDRMNRMDRMRHGVPHLCGEMSGVVLGDVGEDLLFTAFALEFRKEALLTSCPTIQEKMDRMGAPSPRG